MEFNWSGAFKTNETFMVINKILKNFLTRTRISNSDIIFFCSSGEISSDIIYKIKSVFFITGMMESIRLNFQHIILIYFFFTLAEISSNNVDHLIYLNSHDCRTGIVIGSGKKFDIVF